MKLGYRVSAAAMLLSLSSCAAPAQSGKLQPLPLAEPPAAACCKCSDTLSKLKQHLETSDAIVIGEGHADASHYAAISVHLRTLHELGVRKIYLELDGSLNGVIAEYQALRKTLRETSEDDKQKRNEIIRQMTELKLSAEFIDFYDPSEAGYLLSLIENATLLGIKIVCVDMPDDEIEKRAEQAGMPRKKFVISKDGLKARNEYIARMVLADIDAGDKVLVLVGMLHYGVADILAAAGKKAVYIYSTGE